MLRLEKNLIFSFFYIKNHILYKGANMFKELKNIIYDKTFRITILENKIDIINYENILVFEDEKIIIQTKKELVKIIGTNLIISKLYNNEVLIKGNIKKVELG